GDGEEIVAAAGALDALGAPRVAEWVAVLYAGRIPRGTVPDPIARRLTRTARQGSGPLRARALDVGASWLPAPSAADDLQVRCFGSFEVTVGSVPIALDAVRPRTLRLLELLCIYANRELHSEKLIDHLWPESPVTRGAHRLQVAVSEVRRLLQP